jgi:hypothetical protein
MANMGYCRFQNTLQDLRDCYEHMDDDLEESEHSARARLLFLCQEIVDDYVVNGVPAFSEK